MNSISINSASGLTWPEQDVADALGTAWNDYVKLPQQHPDDLAVFRDAIHRAQELLAMRIVRRSHPAYWPIHPAETEEVPA